MNVKILLTLIIVAVYLTACKQDAPKSLYEKLEKKALATGERHDSLFFGIHLGMEKKTFFVHCAELNKDTILYQGLYGKVEHSFGDTELKYPSTMNFYPDFYENKIWRVPVTFSYRAWSPWNKDFQAPLLEERLVTLLMKWYGGNNFEKVPHPEGYALVKLDGNRRILLERDKTGAFISATFTDLIVEKKLLKKQDEAMKAAEKEAKKQKQ